jgi:hypothetical protein
VCIRRQAKKFPGYTAENLSERGVHEVSQRRFVLVAAGASALNCQSNPQSS